MPYLHDLRSPSPPVSTTTAGSQPSISQTAAYQAITTSPPPQPTNGYSTYRPPYHHLRRRSSGASSVASSGSVYTDASWPDRVPRGAGSSRPLTASELHAQLEKEQEAVINRLTRELSTLRTSSSSTEDLPLTLPMNVTRARSGSASTVFTTAATAATSTLSRQNSTTSSISGEWSISGGGVVVDEHHQPGDGRHEGRGSGFDAGRYEVGRYDSSRYEPSRAEGRVEIVRGYSERSEARSEARSDAGRSDAGRSEGGRSTVEDALEARRDLEGVRRENELLRRRVRELESELRREREGREREGRERDLVVVHAR